MGYPRGFKAGQLGDLTSHGCKVAQLKESPAQNMVAFCIEMISFRDY